MFQEGTLSYSDSPLRDAQAQILEASTTQGPLLTSLLLRCLPLRLDEFRQNSAMVSDRPCPLRSPYFVLFDVSVWCWHGPQDLLTGTRPPLPGLPSLTQISVALTSRHSPHYSNAVAGFNQGQQQSRLRPRILVIRSCLGAISYSRRMCSSRGMQF